MADRTVTVFSDKGQDFVALVLHRNSKVKEHGFLLAEVTKSAATRIAEQYEANGHNVAAMVISEIIARTKPGDPELVKPDHDTLAALDYPTFYIDVDGDVIVANFADDYGIEVFAGSLDELEAFCDLYPEQFVQPRGLGPGGEI